MYVYYLLLANLGNNHEMTEMQKSPKPKARFPLPKFTAWVHGPSWRPVNSGAFLTPVNSGRQLGCQKMHPTSRAVNSARELGPWTRVVETGLN